jgi:hypothetical protein
MGITEIKEWGHSENLNTAEYLNIRVGILCRKFRKENGNSVPFSFDVITKTFPDNPNDFTQVYGGNLKLFDGKSTFTFEWKDSSGNPSRRNFLSKDRYIPTRYEYTLYTPYEENKLSVVRYTYQAGFYPQYRQEYFPEVTINENSIKLKKPELVRDLTQEDLKIWHDLVFEAELGCDGYLKR